MMLNTDGTYSAEDTSFCWLFRRAGGRIYVDVTLQLAHRTGAMLMGDPARLFMPPAV